MEKEYEVFYEERIKNEIARFYYDDEIGEVEIHWIYPNGERDSISLPVNTLKHFMDKLINKKEVK